MRLQSPADIFCSPDLLSHRNRHVLYFPPLPLPDFLASAFFFQEFVQQEEEGRQKFSVIVRPRIPPSASWRSCPPASSRDGGTTESQKKRVRKCVLWQWITHTVKAGEGGGGEGKGLCNSFKERLGPGVSRQLCRGKKKRSKISSFLSLPKEEGEEEKKVVRIALNIQFLFVLLFLLFLRPLRSQE